MPKIPVSYIQPDEKIVTPPPAIPNSRMVIREAFIAEQTELTQQLSLALASATLNDSELLISQWLKKYLPRRYQVEQGIVIDSNGNSSDPIGIIIFDSFHTPTLLDLQAHKFIPAEAVYCVLEVKSSIDKQSLDYVSQKAASVRKLERTSVVITSSSGTYPAKKLFPVIAGIIALNTVWDDGLENPSFAKHLKTLRQEHVIDCGLALSDRAFDNFGGTLALTGMQGSLAVFLFQLLERLQLLGTVPATDWSKYASMLDSH